MKSFIEVYVVEKFRIYFLSVEGEIFLWDRICEFDSNVWSEDLY